MQDLGRRTKALELEGGCGECPVRGTSPVKYVRAPGARRKKLEGGGKPLAEDQSAVWPKKTGFGMPGPRRSGGAKLCIPRPISLVGDERRSLGREGVGGKQVCGTVNRDEAAMALCQKKVGWVVESQPDGINQPDESEPGKKRGIERKGECEHANVGKKSK